MISVLDRKCYGKRRRDRGKWHLPELRAGQAAVISANQCWPSQD